MYQSELEIFLHLAQVVGLVEHRVSGKRVNVVTIMRYVDQEILLLAITACVGSLSYPVTQAQHAFCLIYKLEVLVGSSRLAAERAKMCSEPNDALGGHWETQPSFVCSCMPHGPI